MQLLNHILIQQYLSNNHKFDENGNMILEAEKPPKPCQKQQEIKN